MLGPVWGFDLARLTGFCVGAPGSTPRSGHVVLGKPGQRATIFGNMIAFLNDEWSVERPRLVAVEAPLNLEGYRARKNSQDRVKMDYGLHAIVEAMCNRFAVTQLVSGHVSTITKHFLGAGRVPKEDDRKQCMVMRCHQLDYFPKSIWDEDRADACGVWDWACATFCRTPPRALHLFGEERV